MLHGLFPKKKSVKKILYNLSQFGHFVFFGDDILIYYIFIYIIKFKFIHNKIKFEIKKQISNLI